MPPASRPTVALLILALALVLSPSQLRPPPTAAAPPAGIAAWGASDIFVVNQDPAQEAMVVAEFYSLSGDPPIQVMPGPLGPGAVVRLDLASFPSLPDGAYAAAIHSDRPIGALAETGWPTSGGAVALSAAPTASDLIVPRVVKQHEGECSLVTVHNTDPSNEVVADLRVYGTSSAQALLDLLLNLAAGNAATVSLCDDMLFEALPNGFVGFMRISATSASLAATSIVDLAQSQVGVDGSEALDVEAAAEKLFAPVVYAAWDPAEGAAPAFQTLNSVVTVTNPGPEPASVVFTYVGTAGSCAGQLFALNPIVLPPDTLADIPQHPSATSSWGQSPLPAGCAATATLAATGNPVLAVVTVRSAIGSMQTVAGAYNALPATDARQRAYLPWLGEKGGAGARRGGAAALEGLARLTAPAGTALHARVDVPVLRRRFNNVSTGLWVMNLGPEPADAQLVVAGADGQAFAGCGAACQAVVQPGSAAHWWAADLDGVPDFTLGSARVEATQPVAVVAYELASNGREDLVIFPGFTAPRHGDPVSRWLPLVIKEG